MAHIWTTEEKEYLKQVVKGKSYKEIAGLMSIRFGHEFNDGQIKNAINRYKLNTGRNGQFAKGQAAWNKGTKGATGANRTSFKKGDRPHNYKPVGSERISKDGYVEVKISEPGKWKPKHLIIWEEKNGPVPKGSCIIFGDGDKTNLDVNNLMLISRKQLLFLNNNKLIQNDISLTKVGLNIADLLIKINEKKKK